MIDPKLVDLLNKEAASFAAFLDKRIKEVFSQPKFQATGNLLRSVKTTVQAGTDGKMPVVIVEFADYGTILDKSKIYWSKMPRVKELAEWLIKSGKVNQFNTIPGYGAGSGTSISVQKKAERIAWGIAKDKLKRDTWKAKKWRGKTIKSALKVLNDNVLKIWDEFVNSRITTALETGK